MSQKSWAIFLAATAVATSVWASDSTWSGASSSSWSDLTNWSSGVPGASDKATIPVVATQYPTISGSATVTGLAMDGGTQLTLQNGATFTVSYTATKSISLNGTISATGSGTKLELSAGQRDYTNAGVLEFSSGAGFKSADTSYGLASDRTLFNTGGTIRATTSDTTIYLPFTMVQGGTVDGNWYAQSTLATYFGSVLTFDSVTMGSSFAAVSDSSHPAVFTLLNSATNNSAGWSYPTNGTMTLAANSGGSQFTFAGNGKFSLAGQSLGGTGITTLANNGTHTLGGYGTISPATLNNAGTIKATGGASGALKTLNVGTLNSTGSIVVDQFNTLSASGNIASTDSGSLVNVSGTLSAPAIAIGGTLSGTGTIHSAVTLASTSIVSPGNSVGTITVDSLVVNDGSTWNVEGGDLINVTGEVTFLPGAQININLDPAIPNGKYTFFTAGSISGATPVFNISNPALSVIQEGNAFTVTVPEPTIIGALSAASLLTLVRKRTPKTARA